MPLSSGNYTISIPTMAGICYIGCPKGDPDALTILPGNVDPPIVRSLNRANPDRCHADTCSAF